MSKILDSYKTNSAIRSIISNAEKYIVLICPFAPNDDFVFKDYIQLRKSDDVFMYFFFRSSWVPYKDYEYKNDDLTRIFKHYGSLRNVLLFRIPSSCAEFHAKCYFNESDFLISSMNLSYHTRKFSSLECSVLFSLENDPDEFSQCIDWFYLFCKFTNMPSYLASGILNNSLRFGYCIMCGVNVTIDKRIPVNEDFPFCVECAWRYYEDQSRRVYRTYRYCHCCGEPVGAINKKAPICYNCLNNSISNL